MDADLAVYRSKKPLAACVVGHGAGAGQNSPFMVRFAQGMADRGVSAATFDFPYMAARRGAPDKPAVLEAAWRAAVDEARSACSRDCRSSSAASRWAAASPRTSRRKARPAWPECSSSAIRCIRPARPRSAVTRICPRSPSRCCSSRARGTRSARRQKSRRCCPTLQRATLHVVEDGDHSFKVRARSGQKPDQVLDQHHGRRRVVDDVAAGRPPRGSARLIRILLALATSGTQGPAPCAMCRALASSTECDSVRLASLRAIATSFA